MSQPIFEWTFDGNIWPHKTFMGRRWVELWDGRVVKPSNGCLYFWGCIISTVFWVLRGSFLFPIRKGRDFIDDHLPEPTPKEQHAKIQQEIPKPIKIIGKGIHWVFATEYSPFRILGVGIRNLFSWMSEWDWDSIGNFLGILLFLAAAVLFILLLIFETISALLFLAIIIGGLAGGFIIIVLISLVVQSGIFQLTWGMIRASKDKVCPAIRIV